MSRVSLLPCLGLLAACAATPEEAATSSYVLVDPAARAAGYTLGETTGAPPTALPTAIEGEAQVAGPSGRFAIDVPAGEIAYVHGDEGAIDLLVPGTDVDPDRVRVTGREAAVRALAEALGAAMTADGDGWILRADDMVAQLASLPAPEGIDEVALIALGARQDVAPVTLPAPVAMPAPAPAAPVAASRVAVLAERAGASAIDAATIGVGCDDAIAGRWIGQAYTPESGGWHQFTLTIARRGTALTGSIEARFWPGDETERFAPRDSTGGDLARHTPMIGKGTIGADGVAFKAVRFADSRDHGGYALDAFTGPLDRATSRFAAVNNDGAVAFDRAYAFHRVACE